jgi:peptidoglycan hydrolase CwlO-like protein
MNKYILLTFVTLGIPSLFIGCAGLSSKASRTQEEHLSSIDQKIQELEQKLSNLNASAQNLGNRVEELSQKAIDTDANYSKLQNALEGLSSKVELKESALEAILAETQKNISDHERKIAEIEKAKADLQNQLLSLQTQRSRLTGSKIEQQAEAMKEEAKEMIEQGREMVKEAIGAKKSEDGKKLEAIAANHEKEALQKLLDEALVSYRDGRYKEAIGKWEEVLVIDPENLEAKFNIEIAKEKIKSLSEK